MQTYQVQFNFASNIQKKIKNFYGVCVCIPTCHIWRSEDNFKKLDLFFFHLGPGD